MTLTLELPSEVEKLLCAVAKERGVSLEEIVALYPDASEETLEELEDEVDVAEAERRMANSDPSQWKTLDDLRKAWNL